MTIKDILNLLENKVLNLDTEIYLSATDSFGYDYTSPLEIYLKRENILFLQQECAKYED